MASLPEFHAFNEAAAADGEGSLGSPVAQAGQVAQETEAADHGASKDPLASSSAQATQATEFPGTKADVVEMISSELASLHAKVTSMPFKPEDPATVEMLQLIFNLERLQSAILDTDASSFVTHQQASSALAYLRSTASSEHLDSHGPANAALLGQISDLEQQLTKNVMPIVSIDIIQSIFFVAMGVSRFIVRSAMPPAALAVGVFMFLHPRAGNLSTITATLLSVVAVLMTAQVYLTLSACSIIAKNQAKFNNKARTDLSKLDAASYLYVLGSGGHTTEMISLVKLSHKPYAHTHRRYLTTVGDPYSLKSVKLFEDDIAKVYPDGSAGTSDMIIVTRARSVHQSWASSVLTSLQSFLEIAGALTSIPSPRIGEPNAEAFRCPHVIVTNGPGTGFIVGLVAFLLKVFRVVPRDRVKVVFVETWARTHSLGLTGKLFNLTQIADVFVVQSEALAQAVNKPNIGNVNKMWAGLKNSTS